jgi:hypothetical protein
MSRAEDRMDFPISAEWRAFRPPCCGSSNNDVAALHNAGLSCTAAMDIIAAVRGVVGGEQTGDHRSYMTIVGSTAWVR